MQIAFKNKAIRNICEDEVVAINQFGKEIAFKLHSRLADIAAAKNVKDLVAGRPSEIENNPHSNYKLNLSNNYILIFAANNVDLPLLENKTVNWTKVDRIKILEIREQNG